MNEPTRILIVSASPWNRESTTAEEEMSAIQNIFPASFNAAYLVDYKSAAKVEDVHKRLIEFKPHILHFCGHGEEYGLYFLDDKGNAALVETEVLIELVTKSSPTKIQCVILNACDTEKIAESLVQQIEYVIGMRGAINGMAAVNFAKGFYTAINNGQKIPDAFNNGRLSMRLANIDNNTGVPQLKTSHLAKPFLTDYPVDVLIHTVEGNRDWAEFFASNLENALQRKMPAQPPLIRVETRADADLIKHSGLSLFVLSPDYNDIDRNFFASLEFNMANHFAIKTSAFADNLPAALQGLTPYSFFSDADSHAYTEELLKLSDAITQRLRALNEQSIKKNVPDSFSEQLVLVHPHVNDIDAGKRLKPLIQQKGLACFAPDNKTYNSIKTWQKNCVGVIIVHGSDFNWTQDTLASYVNLQKRRKGKLIVVAIEADCSKEDKDCETLDIYPSVSVVKSPPPEDVVNHVAQVLSRNHPDK